MSILNTNRYVAYDGSDSPGPFSFAFKIHDDDDIRVIRHTYNGSTWDHVLQTKTTHYTVDGVNDPAGGTITLTYNLPSNTNGQPEKITIERHIPRLQESDFRNPGRFFGETIEDTLDRIVMMVQRMSPTVYTSPTIPPASAYYHGDVILMKDAGLPGYYMVCLPETDGVTYDWITVQTGVF